MGLFGGKKKETQAGSIGLKSMAENVKVLIKSGRKKEAIAYLYILYTKLAGKRWNVKRKPSQSMREYAMVLVKEKNHNPNNAFDFLNKVESIIYGGVEPSDQAYAETKEIFERVFTEITNKALPSYFN